MSRSSRLITKPISASSIMHICWRQSSQTPTKRVPRTDTKWIDVKRTIYRNRVDCELVLIIEQDRMEVRVDVKTEAGWNSKTLGPADELYLAPSGYVAPWPICVKELL